MTNNYPKSEKTGKADSDSAENTEEYYFENGFMVFTAKYHTQRGFCCGNGCRHCPYQPKHQRGSKVLSPGL